ncbi:hypothetical protein ANN_02927 [Periplaneta americana]|uniref:Mos1 transposase HTH domain-containing protein n=1 Tax=Periplaneta americana TaxID=6978 RepID=A0ABQ8TXM6_PERAM|nr:hypothetical protein ANN_02927 [Periplaneta americana]
MGPVPSQHRDALGELRRVYGGVASDPKSIRLWFNKLLTTGSVLKQSGGARCSVIEEKVEEIERDFREARVNPFARHQGNSMEQQVDLRLDHVGPTHWEKKQETSKEKVVRRESGAQWTRTARERQA